MNRYILINVLFILITSIAYAQTDRIADSAVIPTPVKMGTRVPEGFWTTSHLFYINGDTVRRTLEEHKGKLVVIDYWSRYCAKCILHQKEIIPFKEKYADKLAVIMVSSKRTKEGYDLIDSEYKSGYFKHNGIENFVTIINDEYLSQLLPPSFYPAYYWINDAGYLQLVTYRNLLDSDYQVPFLDH